MAFISTLAASDANSFLSVERAISLLTELPDSPGVVSWLALEEEQQEKTLVASTMTINPLRWKGFVATPDQSLAWPRNIKIDGRRLPSDELPLDFEYAVAYMAAFLSTNGGYTGIPTGNDGGVQLQQNDQYSEVELGSGALRVKFKEDNSGQSGFEYIPPFVMDILSKYIVDSNFSQPYLSKTSAARVAPFYANGLYRQSGIRIAGGLVFPRSGGWASNSL